MTSARTLEELRAVIRRLRFALESSHIGVWEHNLATNEIRWDPQMHALYQTGETAEVVRPRLWVHAIHPDDQATAIADFDAAVAARGPYASDFRIILPSGEIRHIRSRAHYFEEDGPPAMLGAEWDITADVRLTQQLAEQKAIAEDRAVALEESRRQIAHAAEHDYLTGLPNRRSLDREFLRLGALADLKRLAILHVGIDNFKQVNDGFGHAGGDAVLTATAASIVAEVPRSSFSARIGGDEFVVLIPDFESEEAVRAVAEAIVRRQKQAARFGDKPIRTSVSVGVAWTMNGAITSLLADSDIALSAAKRAGRGRAEVFSTAMRAGIRRERRLTEEFKLGLERHEIVPFYQVQVDAQTRRIVAMEALARWQHPDLGLLAPAAFLPMVEHAGLAGQLDAAMLDAVLEHRRCWQALGLSVPRLSVNISAARLNDADLIAQIEARAPEPGTLSFELLETIFLDDIESETVATLDRLRQMHIDLEVDDFGSGHASIVGLVRLKPNRLKIDRRLVMPVTRSSEQLSLVESIIGIARALNIEVIAEGVETGAHADLLAKIGCHILQGYAISRPAAAEDIIALLTAGHA